VRWRPDPERTARTVGPVVGALARSWRLELVHEHRWSALVEAGKPFVFLLWHEMLLPLLWRHRRQGVAIVVSEARDGRYLAAYAERLGYLNLFGSSTRGGARVLLQAVRALESGRPVAFTPDGPRGPRREVKPGIIHAAQKAGASVLPIVAVADRAWRLRSWDRFMCPKPFARVRIGYGAAYPIDPGPEGLDRGAALAKQSLETLERELGWPAGVVTDTE